MTEKKYLRRAFSFIWHNLYRNLHVYARFFITYCYVYALDFAHSLHLLLSKFPKFLATADNILKRSFLVLCPQLPSVEIQNALKIKIEFRPGFTGLTFILGKLF